MQDSRLRTLDQINAMDHAEFIATLGPIYEKSPWIASRAWERIPFASAAELLATMNGIVESADEERLLELLRAHPDLAARLDEIPKLTGESRAEQTAAGLLDLPPDRAARLRELIDTYRSRFEFPFIICARLNDSGTILASVEDRLCNGRDSEIQTAWAEVQKIAELRLRDLVVWS